MKLRLITLLLCLAALGTALIIHGCAGYNIKPTQPAVAATQPAAPADPQAALEDIYYDVEIMGIQDATPTVLEDKFRIDSSLYTSADAKYADGRYGVADVFIFKIAPGKEDELKEALEQVKLSRIMEFKNYDIYNSLQLSEDGQIFTRGEYMILTMIENAEPVREIIEKHIPAS